MATTLRLQLWSSKLKFYLHQSKPSISPFTKTSYKPYSSQSFSSTTHLSNRIGTHNGSFHCDEALGCFLLRRTSKFADSHIIQTRDLQVLDSLDAVIDVGGVYDPSRDRYDHHQKGFDEIFGHGFSTKLSVELMSQIKVLQVTLGIQDLWSPRLMMMASYLIFLLVSSAGLVYKHYGKEIIAKELQLDGGHPHLHRLFLAVYKNFIAAVDAVDNGINQYSTDISPKYVINTYLSSRVGRLNLNWTDTDQSAEQEDIAFQKAMTLAGNEFLENIHFHAQSWLPARSIVMESLAARQDIDSSGEIMVLNKSCPWKLHIFELEEEMKVEPSIKYVIYEDDSRTSWRVQAVALGPDRFESRKPLLHQWRGLEGKELSKVAMIPGCVFVHISGFIGGNRIYEGAVEMA